MLKFGILKYYLVYFFSVAYTFGLTSTPFITWNTPYHLEILMRIVVGLGTFFFGLTLILSLGEDLPDRKSSFESLGNKKVSQIWSIVFLPMIVYGLYAWENVFLLVIMIASYFGMKAIIKNHNKHVQKYNEEQVLAQARQEQAEKVTL